MADGSDNLSEFGCAAIILALCVGIAIIIWAAQGFPGLR